MRHRRRGEALAGLEENAVRAGISGALLAPFAGKLAGVRGRAFAGAVSGLEQVASNKILGRETSEGVAQAITNGVVIRGITEKHANTMAPKKLGAAPAEGHPVRLPGESPAASATNRVGAAALVEANEALLALARPDVDHERSGVMKRLIPDADVRTKLDIELREARAERPSMTPEAYKAKVEATLPPGPRGSTTQVAPPRESVCRRYRTRRWIRMSRLLSILDAGERSKGAEAQALVALELAGVAEMQIKADHARARKAMPPEQTRDAIAQTCRRAASRRPRRRWQRRVARGPRLAALASRALARGPRELPAGAHLLARCVILVR